jgi:hypothetical protein
VDVDAATVAASEGAAAVTTERNVALSVDMGTNTAIPATPLDVGALMTTAGLALLVVDKTGE